ncbi:hypothetical protein [Arenibaculum pallidiluteum]|uniref:hypothetical protein n=1 Tax=Arenibaculum pallidiluteum TaxID=2812559 RepID=UPI001A968DE9|nr:hypothetical protein [Arenibaculum pallidiluteum]
MRILAREHGGYRIECPDGHVFMSDRLAISVECPLCGRTELASTLVDQVMVPGQPSGDAPPRDAA